MREAQPQGQARQHEVVGPGANALAQGLVALDGKHVQGHGQPIDQEVGNHKDRQREAEHGQRHDGMIDPGIGAPGRDHADRYGEQDHHDGGGDGERNRRLHALGQKPRDRLVGKDRNAEVAAQQATEPDRELLIERPIETELAANVGNLLRRGMVAGDQPGRVAGTEMENGEHHDRHDAEHRQGGQDPPCDIAIHFHTPGGEGRREARAPTRDERRPSVSRCSSRTATAPGSDR